MIGGISYFHEFAYDLLAENERILASTFDAAIAAHRDGHLERIIVVSQLDGLRVGDGLPDARGRPADARRRRSRPTASRSSRPSTSPRAPGSSTSCRTRSSGRSTASGIGERRARPRHRHHERQREARPVATSCRTSSSRCSRARTRSTSSATGDQVRHYTYGGDLAHGIRLAMESPAAVNDDFNLSTAASTTVLELAEAIWHKIHTDGPAVPLRLATRRSSTTSSCASRTSARRARSSASRRRRRSTQMLDEVIPWIRGGARGRDGSDDRRRCCRSSCPCSRRARRSSPCSERSTRRRDPARDPRRLRLRRGPDRARSSTGWPPSCRPSAGLRNDLGRGVLNAMKAGIAASTRRVRPDLDGRRLRRAARRRPDGRARARRRGRRRPRRATCAAATRSAGRRSSG